MNMISADDISQVLGHQASAQVQVGKCMPPRSRRPRVTIELELTEEQRRTLDKDEIQKLKNRVAAKRARERVQQHTADLEDMVKELWNRVQYLEGVVQTAVPGQSLKDLYNNYVPYADSQTLEPLVGDLSADGQDQYMMDMEQLDWLLNTELPDLDGGHGAA